MKKYNISKIMKREWEIKRENNENLFAMCLKFAWEEAKNMKEKFNYSAELDGYTFKYWEERITHYRRISIFNTKNNYVGCIDIEFNNRIDITRKDNWAEETATQFLDKYDFSEKVALYPVLEGTERQVKKAIKVRGKFINEVTNSFNKVGGIEKVKQLKNGEGLINAYRMALKQNNAVFWIENDYEDLENEVLARRKMTNNILKKFF